MEGFDHILNWTLKAGSHRFPGPDGGTCINEAALVAAGFEYRPVRDVYRMPRCFSRPICPHRGLSIARRSSGRLVTLRPPNGYSGAFAL